MIKDLPKSLIDVARMVLGEHNNPNERIPCNYLVKPLNAISSLHSEFRNDECPYSWSHVVLSESISEFHDWALETEHNKNFKLPVEAYLTHGNVKDDVQMSHRFKTIPMTHPSLYDAHAKNLTRNEKKSVVSFLNAGLHQNPPLPSGSMYINAELLNAHYHRRKTPKQIVHPNSEVFHVGDLDSAISKSKLPKMDTYAGVRFDPGELMSEQGFIESPAYLSTSTRRYTAGKYAVVKPGLHHILHIHHDKGDTGIYVGNDTQLSRFKDDEVILPRNELLKINGYKDLNHGEHTFRIWDVTRHKEHKQ